MHLTRNWPCAVVEEEAWPSTIKRSMSIAEGAGEFSRKEKARFYRMARRSAIEQAGWLEIIARRHEAPEPVLKRAQHRAQDVVSMLVKLIQSCERSSLK